jgi:hypothetical protein
LFKDQPVISAKQEHLLQQYKDPLSCSSTSQGAKPEHLKCGCILLTACRLVNGSHIELPCSEVTGAAQRRIAATFDSQARSWWASVLAEPHSFTKPVFQIGLGGWKASNVEASGAIEMSRGDVWLASLAEFSSTGRVCWKVNVRGEAPASSIAGCLLFQSCQLLHL